MKSSRLKAFEILHGILTASDYSNLALESSLKDADERDRAFISRLVLGSVERKITLDYIIGRYIDSKPKPKVKTILYLSAYQLYYMDAVPSSAVINEAVTLAGEVGCSYYKGFINAVLRRIDEKRIDIEGLDDLSVRYSCPQELINMWTKHYGAERTLEILSSLNSKPPVFAVPNPLYVNAEELAYELTCEKLECEVEGELVRILSPYNPKRSKAFKNGLLHIEDKSSYECARALNAEPGDTVLDVCSAPGGKAFTAAERMNNEGEIFAFDIYESRLKLIREGADRLGLSIIKTAVNDAPAFNPELPTADKILCDVPCSGFGIIRRKPEIKYKSLDSVKQLSQLQYDILSTSSKYLKKGGRLIYSTCTLNKNENEKVVKRFLESSGGFSLLEEKTVFPSEDGGDGFYYAVITK